VGELLDLLYVFTQSTTLRDKLFPRQVLAVSGALLQQRFHGSLFVFGRLGGSRFGILGLRPRAQEHGDLQKLRRIGRANRSCS
jgi:hypothetical protein